MEGVIVLDTSVVIKWFRQGEVLAQQALMVRDAYLEGEIEVAAPSLLTYELANVLRYRKDLDASQVQEAVLSLVDMGLEVIPLSSPLVRRSIDIAYTYRATVYDAAFAALAESLNATLITADERLVHQLTPLPRVRFLAETRRT